MANISSKIELLYMISELKESGDVENAMRLQRIFLESISEDRKTGKYSVNVALDRKGKKAVLGAKDALTTSKDRHRKSDGKHLTKQILYSNLYST